MTESNENRTDLAMKQSVRRYPARTLSPSPVKTARCEDRPVQISATVERAAREMTVGVLRSTILLDGENETPPGAIEPAPQARAREDRPREFARF